MATATHGGPRRGAGRPKTKAYTEEKQKIIFYLDAETHQLLRDRADDKDMSQSEVIRRILRRSLRRTS